MRTYGQCRLSVSLGCSSTLSLTSQSLSLSAKLQHFPAPTLHKSSSQKSLSPTVSTAHNLALLASTPSSSLSSHPTSSSGPPLLPLPPSLPSSPNTRSRTRGLKEAANALLDGPAEMQGKAKEKEGKKASSQSGSRRKSKFSQCYQVASFLVLCNAPNDHKHVD